MRRSTWPPVSKSREPHLSTEWKVGRWAWEYCRQLSRSDSISDMVVLTSQGSARRAVGNSVELAHGACFGERWFRALLSSSCLLYSGKHMTNILGESVNFQICIINALNNEVSPKEKVDVLEENIFHGLKMLWKNIHISFSTLGLRRKLRWGMKYYFLLLSAPHLLNLSVPKNAVEVNFFLKFSSACSLSFSSHWFLQLNYKALTKGFNKGNADSPEWRQFGMVPLWQGTSLSRSNQSEQGAIDKSWSGRN